MQTFIYQKLIIHVSFPTKLLACVLQQNKGVKLEKGRPVAQETEDPVQQRRKAVLRETICRMKSLMVTADGPDWNGLEHFKAVKRIDYLIHLNILRGDFQSWGEGRNLGVEFMMGT